MPSGDDPSLVLVARIQAGTEPEESFGQLHKLYGRKVHSFFLHRGFSTEDARELTQDVFFRVFRGIGAFRGESSFKTWLFEIADHVYQNELRRRGTFKRKGWVVSLETGGVGEDGEEVPLEPPPEPPRALDGMLERERAEALSRAIQELPEQMRTCFLLRYGQGRRYKEIAVILRISIDTVKAHLHQARKRLRLKLADEPDD